MAIAYYAGAAIGVCIASAVVDLALGGVAGYVIAEVKKEKDGDPNIDVATALKNVFTTQPLSENVIALKWK